MFKKRLNTFVSIVYILIYLFIYYLNIKEINYNIFKIPNSSIALTKAIIDQSNVYRVSNNILVCIAYLFIYLFTYLFPYLFISLFIHSFMFCV